jgi:hypothetical protein
MFRPFFGRDRKPRSVRLSVAPMSTAARFRKPLALEPLKLSADRRGNANGGHRLPEAAFWHKEVTESQPRESLSAAPHQGAGSECTGGEKSSGRGTFSPLPPMHRGLALRCWGVNTFACTLVKRTSKVDERLFNRGTRQSRGSLRLCSAA